MVTAEIGRMAGVVSATNEMRNDQAQGMVYFWLHVRVDDRVSEGQLAAITRAYLHALGSGEFEGYRVELEVRRDWNVFRVDSGELPITNADQIIEQARSWVALRRQFSAATVRLRATIVHPDSQRPIREVGRSNTVVLDLPDPSDYRAVSAAAQTLAARFPNLAGLDWSIRAGRQYPAEIHSSLRLPNPSEIAMFNLLNADQTIPHIDQLVINGPSTPSVWISEKTTQSHDVDVALELARRHLPLVATLSPPTLYTATDELSGHIGAHGSARGPVAVTVGGCTPRDSAVYVPIPAERALIDAYEVCKP